MFFRVCLSEHNPEAEAFDVRRAIATVLLAKPPQVGDWVMVHVGYAIETLEYEEAMEILTLLDAVAKEGAIDTSGGLFEIYQLTEHGISLQATIAGTRYWKDQELNRK